MLPQQHAIGGGRQHFAYDAKVAGWNKNNDKLSSIRTDGTTNADSFAWGRPVYSMANGTVLSAVNDHPDNPGPGRRGFVRKPGEFVVATLTHDGGRTVLTLWRVPSDGLSMTAVSTVSIPGAVTGRLTKLGNVLLTATQTATGKLDLMLWRIANDKLVDTPAGHAVSQGQHGVRCPSRRLEPLRARNPYDTRQPAPDTGGNGQDEDAELGLSLVGVGTGGAVSEIALCKNHTAGQVTTAVRTGSGKLKVIVWSVLDDTDPVRWAEDEYTTASTIDVSPFVEVFMGVAAGSMANCGCCPSRPRGTRHQGPQAGAPPRTSSRATTS